MTPTAAHTPDRKMVAACLALAVLEGLAAIIALALIDPDPKNAWLFGFSKQRLLLIGMVFAGVLAFAAALVAVVRFPGGMGALAGKILGSPRRQSWLAWILGLAFLVTACLVFLPAYRTGALQDYFLRLRPVIIWLALVFGQTWLTLLLLRGDADIKDWAERRRSDWLLLRIGLIAYGLMLLLWLLFAMTGLGLQPDSAFWNQAGTPVMGIQLTIAWLAAYIFWRVLAGIQPTRRRFADFAAVFLVWTVAVLLWKAAPFFGDYFASALHPPNFEHYPASDAQVFDVSAQFALIGQGYANNSLVSRPFFTFFLTSVYALFGNDIDTVVNAQIVIYALIPIALYGLGLQLGKRPAGLFAGLMLVFIQANAIATSHIVQRTNVRLLMTEMPAALMIIVITWLLVRWWQLPERRWVLLPLAGGILGFSTMVRQNTWALLVAIPVFAVIVLWHQRRRMGKFLLWFVIGFFAAISPWMVRSASITGNPLYILGPLRHVVWGNRLSELVGVQPKTLATSPAATPAATGRVGTPTPGGEPGKTPESIPPPAPLQTAAGQPFTLVKTIASHFSHNLVASSLVFPSSVTLHDIDHLMNQPGSYWQLDWQGEIDGERVAFLMLSLGVLSLGIAYAWRSRMPAGLLPLWIGLSYHGGTAIARTSGGRYLVPVEWVLPLYFALGAWLLTTWLADYLTPDNPRFEDDEPTPDAPVSGAERRGALQPWMVCLGLLAFGALMTTADWFFPAKFNRMTDGELRTRLLAIEPLQSLDGFDQLLQSPDLLVLEGASLYPIHLGFDVFEPGVGDAAPQGEYPLFITRLIGPHGSRVVALPQNDPPAIAHASRIWAVGCQGAGYFDALAVILWDGAEPAVFVREPLSDVQCPLPQPQCDLNRNCK